MKYDNPILSGYHPDPSICRVGEDYYIANSSFEFFPGVPVYHSRNLVNWEAVGYCLTRKSQLYLENAPCSGGIFAPTLRYHNGEFFMITTNVTEGKGHLIVHTRDIRGEWSEPVWVDQGGIDPTLLFDEDDVYFASTSLDEEGRQGIFLCRINPYTGEKLEDSACISYGCGGCCPEGPHLYKWFGKYYLLMAEGGTEYGHMVTLQRADSPYGPYETCPHNPVLSHRDDVVGDIACTGHADMVEDHNGNWWLVCLGIRVCSYEGRNVRLHNLGRETFLAPVHWTEEGWPVIGDQGRLALSMEGPLPGSEVGSVSRDFQDDFTEEMFSLRYNYLRNPERENYVRDTNRRQLILKGTDVTLNDAASPTWLGIRQKEFATEAEVWIRIPQQKEISRMQTESCNAKKYRAGLTVFYNEAYHYEIYLTVEGEETKINLAKHVHDIFAVTAGAVIPSTGWIRLKMISDKEYYHFFYSTDGDTDTKLGKGSTAGMATEGTMMMTFTGTYIGLFAENGEGVFREFSVKVPERQV